MEIMATEWIPWPLNKNRQPAASPLPPFAASPENRRCKYLQMPDKILPYRIRPPGLDFLL
jgi:hypothetical protein